MNSIKLKTTLKGAALVAAIDFGLLSADENGDIDTSRFDAFWNVVETRIQHMENCRRRQTLMLQTWLSCSALLISILSLSIRLIAK